MSARDPRIHPALDNAGLDPALTRRFVQDPALQERLVVAVRHAARAVTARRVRDWCARDDGAFPRREASYAEATEELTLLCRGLGSLCAITPAEIDEAVRVFWGGEEDPFG